MRKITCSSLILGAGFYGCGLAARRPGALIVEPNVVPGAEFTLTFDPGRNWNAPVRHPLAVEFRRALETRRVLENGRVHQAALLPVFAKWCLDRGLEIRFTCVPVRRENNLVTLRDVEGELLVEAAEVIDTRPAPTTPKYLTAMIGLPMPTPPACRRSPFELFPGIVPGEAHLRFPLPGSVTWPEARARFLRSWAERPVELADARLQLIGTRFTDCRFDNPVEALDRGLREMET